MALYAERMINHPERCGDCEAFEPARSGGHRKFSDRLGHCAKTSIGGKPMSVYKSNYIPGCIISGKFVSRRRSA